VEAGRPPRSTCPVVGVCPWRTSRIRVEGGSFGRRLRRRVAGAREGEGTVSSRYRPDLRWHPPVGRDAVVGSPGDGASRGRYVVVGCGGDGDRADLVFFLFSLIASGINETLTRLTSRRSRFLEQGLWRLLGNNLELKVPPAHVPGADETWYHRFWDHALVRQLAEPGKKRPSYLPARTFAAVVANMFKEDLGKGEAVLAHAPAPSSSRSPPDRGRPG